MSKQPEIVDWPEIRRQAFKQIFNAAQSVDVRAIIAGGAVVDLEHASDIDVFVLQQRYNRVHSRSLAEDCDFLLLELGGTPHNMDAETYIQSDGRGQFYRAGKCRPEWSPKPIHVIGWRHDDGWSATTPHHLLETFDLSIHAWATDAHSSVIVCENSTSMNEPIRVVHLTPTTPDRLVKLTQRYFPARRA